MPTFDAGVVSIIVRNPFMASGSGGGVAGAVAAGLQPAPKSDARNPRSAIILMRVRSGLTSKLGITFLQSSFDSENNINLGDHTK